jgi:hypothetical protein
MTRYVCELGQLEQLVISMRLHRAGIYGEDWFRAMNSRVCDLEEAIDIEEWRRK